MCGWKDEVYAPSARSSTLNIVLGLAVQYGCRPMSGDVPSAYVQAPLPEDSKYYLEQPEGYVDTKNPNYVCCLLKALFGLPIAG